MGTKAAKKSGKGGTRQRAANSVVEPKDKSLENWIWDAACSIRGARGAPKYKDYNASQVFEKGDPKNFIPDAGIQRIAETLIGWKEEQKLSRIVDHAELKKNDYNISPSRYIHTSDAETYRPIAEIVAAERHRSGGEGHRQGTAEDPQATGHMNYPPIDQPNDSVVRNIRTTASANRFRRGVSA